MLKRPVIGGVARSFMLILLLLVSPLFVTFASNAPLRNPVDAFLKTQNDKSDPVLNLQISGLMQAGYTKRGATGAVSLGGDCGVAGCNSTCLVTTSYSTPGVNPRSRVVAAIVTIFNGREFRVKRILAKETLEASFESEIRRTIATE